MDSDERAELARIEEFGEMARAAALEQEAEAARVERVQMGRDHAAAHGALLLREKRLRREARDIRRSPRAQLEEARAAELRAAGGAGAGGAAGGR